MIQKKFSFFYAVSEKYNDLVLCYLIFYSPFAIAAVLIWLTQDLLFFTVWITVIFLLTVPSYFIVNRGLTCPSCKSWKYNIFYSIERLEKQNFKIQYQCKRCKIVWQKK